MAVAEGGRCVLVTGPANSGKSLYAEHLARLAARPVTYLATGPQLPEDEDWQRRLLRHRQRRPAEWDCLEVGRDLAPAIRCCTADRTVLVDSLGTWVAADLCLDCSLWSSRSRELLAVISSCKASVVLVAEETGWGVVPPTASGGLFRQRLGTLLQELMPCCDAAWLVLHGRVIDLLAISQPLPPLTAG